MTVVIGIDPGLNHTGIVVRNGNRLVWHEVISRSKGETSQDYIFRVRTATIHARVASVQADPNGQWPPIVAVEDVEPPNPHMGVINVTGILGTAMVLGAVIGWHQDAVIVPPGGNGSDPLSVYPPDLVGPNEPKGTGKLGHCRSAWDVARRASGVELLAEALKKARGL